MIDPNEGMHDIPGARYVRKGRPFMRNGFRCYNADHQELIDGQWKSWGNFTVKDGITDSMISDELCGLEEL